MSNSDGSQTENVFGSEITYTYDSDYNQVTGKTVSTKSLSAASAVETSTGDADCNVEASASVTKDWFGRTESKSVSLDTAVEYAEGGGRRK